MAANLSHIFPIWEVIMVVIVVVAIVFLLLLVYILSKIQMLGWINAWKQYTKERTEKWNGEEDKKENLDLGTQ